eukprot:gb/GECH01012936.1/.p1 GENE.gb/GECH01012936.1/~~gb/GECH01012936.1/.p1  ORF type:complete len:321 (+),score=59.82 gb/GECH01012936.1/:1-963(+)
MPYPNESLSAYLEAERYFQTMLLQYYEPCIRTRHKKYTTPSGVLKKHFALLHPNTNRQISKEQFHDLIERNSIHAFPVLEKFRPSVDDTYLMIKHELLKEIPFDVLRSLPPKHPYFIPGATGKKKKDTSSKTLKLCKFYVIGLCNSKNCPFSHDAGYLPCRTYYLTGKCPEQSTCPFSHERISRSVAPPISPPRRKRERSVEEIDGFFSNKRRRCKLSSLSPPLVEDGQQKEDEVEKEPNIDFSQQSSAGSPNSGLSQQTSTITKNGDVKTNVKREPLNGDSTLHSIQKREVVPELSAPKESSKTSKSDVVRTEIFDLNQ